jgi:hypothetical protein
MRRRIPTALSSEEFTVDAEAILYLGVLLEDAPKIHPIEPAHIRLAFSEDKNAEWLERGEYVLTFRCDGPMPLPARVRLPSHDARPHYRSWQEEPTLSPEPRLFRPNPSTS